MRDCMNHALCCVANADVKVDCIFHGNCIENNPQSTKMDSRE